MNELGKIFRKVNGFGVLKQYARAGVLGFVLLETIVLGTSRKSLEIVRLAGDHRILEKLRRKYRKFTEEYKISHNERQEVRPIYAHTIWVCWMQGMEQAPQIVKRCYQSLKENLGDREIVVITESNFRTFVSFPKHIMKKYEKGIITKTHFSDLLRLELLARYGGTWIDATVLCTGSDIPEYILDSELFVYQCLKPGRDGHDAVISSWLMTSWSNHPIILLTRALLYRYWETHNYMMDYYLLHDFFQIATEIYPEEWEKVVPFSNSVPHILLLHLFQPFDERWMKYVTDMTCFHKLSYKFAESDMKLGGTYYRWILEKNNDKY